MILCDQSWAISSFTWYTDDIKWNSNSIVIVKKVYSSTIFQISMMFNDLNNKGAASYLSYLKCFQMTNPA